MSVNTKPNKNYNWCIVPKCTNTSLKTPDKTFISVPKNKIRRKLWFNAVKRDWKLLSETSNVFVCEDHFDLEMDMENYVKWKLVGGNKLMKKTVVPHKFDCEVDRKRAFTNVPQSSAVKRARQQLIDEALAGQSTNHEGDYSGADVLFEKEEVVSETNSRDVGVNVQPQHTLRVLILHPRRMAKARKTLGPDETSHTITTDETLTKVLHFKDNSEAASIGEASQTVSAESSFAREEKAKGILRVEKPNNVGTDILTDPENIVNEAQTSFLKMEASCSYHQETENIEQPTSSSSIAFITEDARRWRRANPHDGRRKMVSELQDNKVNQYQYSIDDILFDTSMSAIEAKLSKDIHVDLASTKTFLRIQRQITTELLEIEKKCMEAFL